MKKTNKGTKTKYLSWKRYVYSLIAAEISTIAQYCDECIQIAPEKHDTGILFDAIKTKKKSIVQSIHDIKSHRTDKEKRYAFLINGNFNYLADIQFQLQELHKIFSRHSRLFIVLYNPFIGFLYKLASWLGLRQAPIPDVYLTRKDIYSIAKLTNYDVVRIRPSGYFPFYIPLISDFFNGFLPIFPIIRNISLVWVVVLRPVITNHDNPSLSIIIPARSESGNIETAMQRIPEFPNTDVEIIFIEGNSTDDTWERIQREINKKHKSFPIKAYKQLGTGKNDAVRMGFKNATGELVTILDADLTMPPEMLPRFYEAYIQGKGDFINGSRLIYPMEDDAMQALNRTGNIFFSMVLSWILGTPISDTLCGTKFYSLTDYKRIVQWRQDFGDFDPFGDFEMLFAASELALGIIDIPIQYRARTYGTTNIHRFHHGFQLLRMASVGFFRVLLGKTNS